MFKNPFYVLLELSVQEEQIQLILIIQALLLALSALLVHSAHKKDSQRQCLVELATSHLPVQANVLCVKQVNCAQQIPKPKLFKSHKLVQAFIVKSAFSIKHQLEEPVMELHV